MFYSKVPFSGNIIGDLKNDVKLSSSSSVVEAGSFMTATIENGEGVAKLGSTASTDQFFGISLSNSLGTQVPVVFSGVIPDDKIVTLPSIPVANTECVKVDNVVKTVTTDYTISGTTLTFVTGTAGQKFTIIYKKEVTVTELESLSYSFAYPRGAENEGYIDVALSGEYQITCFDTTCDFESTSIRKVDANGCLSTKGNGVDVSNRVIVVKLPDESNSSMTVRLI